MVYSSYVGYKSMDEKTVFLIYNEQMQYVLNCQLYQMKKMYLKAFDKLWWARAIHK